MVRFVPPNHVPNNPKLSTVAYWKTGKYDVRKRRVINVTTLVNPRWMNYHFQQVFLAMVRAKPNTWMYLPVGENFNDSVPDNMEHTIPMFYCEENDSKSCLFNSFSSALMYSKTKFLHKVTKKRINQIASEIHDLGEKHEDTPLQSQLDKLINVIHQYPDIFFHM